MRRSASAQVRRPLTALGRRSNPSDFRAAEEQPVGFRDAGASGSTGTEQVPSPSWYQGLHQTQHGTEYGLVVPKDPNKNANVRRVARDVSPTYHHFPDPRMWAAYKGGWQNFTVMPQWFWFYFKKYGLTNNFACHMHMRDAWLMSGEKRLVGMDALGQRYWETDLIMRDALHHRWIDWPHHFHWMEWTKLPVSWMCWQKVRQGRSPAQWEQLHRELGPEWRDYQNDLGAGGYPSEQHIFGRQREEETFGGQMLTDGDGGGGADLANPWHPDFKRKRRWYGYYKMWTTDASRNQYDVDEYNPQGGARDWLDVEKNLQSDALSQEKVNAGSNYTNSQLFVNVEGGGHGYGKYAGRWDGGNFYSRCYWEFRQASAQAAKDTRKNVSAFDNMRTSSANVAGHSIFSAETNNYWMLKGDMAREGHNRGSAEAAAHSKSYWRNDMAYGKSHGSKGIFRAS